MSNTVSTIYIDDSNVRLLVMQGKKIKRRATLPLEPGSVESGVVIKEDEVAGKLIQFLRDKGIKAKKIVVGLSGLLNLTRPLQLPKLPQSLMSEAVVREAKRVLPISAEQFYIMWQTIPSSSGKTDVFVSAIRCRAADSVISTLRKAGLNPVVLDLKPLALTRLVKVRTGIILDVQPTEFDIIIMSECIPQPIRTVPLPAEAESWTQKLQLIKTELDRTIDFFNANNPEKVLDSSIPLHISGDITGHPELEPILPDALGHPVVPLSSRLKTAKDTDYSSYMVNVGLALLDSSLVKRAGPSVANSNLLPPVYRPKPVSLIRVVAVPGAVTIVALLIPLFILARGTSANISSLKNQLDTTNRLITQEQTKKKDLKQELTKVEASYKLLNTALGKIETQHSEVNGDMSIVFEKLPSNMTLEAVNLTKNSLTVRGIAPGDLEVLAYASTLEKSGRFQEVIVSILKTVEDKVNQNPVKEEQETENPQNDNPEPENPETKNQESTSQQTGSQHIDFTLILKTKG